MEINVERLIEYKLSLEGYFILHCLYNEENDLLTRYCNSSVYKIPPNVFKQLVDEKYIEYDGIGDYTLLNMTLTDKFKLEVLKMKPTEAISYDAAFQQLREHYPTKTPNGTRRLHQDIERCKKLYKNVIAPVGIVDVEKHQLILQCVNFMLKEKGKKLDDLNYLQALPTYIQQRNWEAVMEDVERTVKSNGYIEKKSSFGDRDEGGNKTQLGNSDF